MTTISKSAAFLEKAFDVLNKQYFDSALPKVIITIQSSPSAYGHFTQYDAWRDPAKAYKEINIAAETLNRPVSNTIATLLHEMVHLYCYEKGIKDTSRSGRYHNSQFKDEAEKRGLQIDYDKTIGWSLTSPKPELRSFVNTQGWRKLTLSRGYEVKDPKVKKPSSTRKYECPCCGMSVRATRDVRIACMECDEVMQKVG